MRYIAKGEEPHILSEFKQLQREAGLNATYKDFREKEALNEVLRAENNYICCYCQNRISTYQKPPETGAHNEHLRCQSGNHELELEFGNLFGCCVRSKGKLKRLQHCGESKDKRDIFGSITNPDCEQLFKYDLNGYIMPNGPYAQWKEYVANKNSLSDSHRVLTEEIEILNLNLDSLVTDRKVALTDMLSVIQTMTVEQLEAFYHDLSDRTPSPKFVSMLRFFIRLFIDKRR